MDSKEIEIMARENLNGSCRVCKVCNGIACAGEVPGMGGKGSGSSFIENYKSLEKVKLNMRVIHDVKNPDTSCTFFGKEMKAPVFAAPVSGTVLNMGGKISEKNYITSVVKGSIRGGIYPMVGDSALESFLLDNLEVLKEVSGDGIVFIKPWKNEEAIRKIKLAEEAGAIAVGMDIDACGLTTLSMHGKFVEPKTVEKIEELKNSTKLPFILKGIMTAEEAELAVKAGVYAIVVSNHGGRVLDQTPGCAQVLPEIARAVKGKVEIFVDGAVVNGIDVIKMLGLGADGVLIGREFVRASFGGGEEAVYQYINKLISEMKSTMTLIGCQSITDINDKIIYNN